MICTMSDGGESGRAAQVAAAVRLFRGWLIRMARRHLGELGILAGTVAFAVIVGILGLWVMHGALH